MTMHSKRLMRLAVIASAVVAGCMTGRNAGSGSSYGFIVIGPTAAKQYRLTKGDTIAEVPVEQVPTVVTSTADREARKLAFDPACSRYFFTGDAYLTLYRSRCEAGIVVDDGAGMALYRQSGQQVGESLSQLVGAFETLQPLDRNRTPKKP